CSADALKRGQIFCCALKSEKHLAPIPVFVQLPAGFQTCCTLCKHTPILGRGYVFPWERQTKSNERESREGANRFPSRHLIVFVVCVHGVEFLDGLSDRKTLLVACGVITESQKRQVSSHIWVVRRE